MWNDLHLACLNQDGSLDETFFPPRLGLIYATINDGTDRTIVGGPSFTITRLFPDGTPDSSFNGPYDTCHWLALDAGNNIFYSSSRRVLKLFSDGNFDASFKASYVYAWDYGIHTLALKTNGNVVLGGGFSYIRNDPTNYYRSSIAEVDRFGQVSTNSFTSGLNSDVWALCTQPDQKVIAGGEFWGSVIRYTEDGQVDPTFTPPYIANWDGFPGWIRAMALQPDGRIIIGGQFVSVGGVSTPNIARLMPDGTLDTTFDPGIGPDNTIRTILVQPDGRIVVGGQFGLWDGMPAGGIVRLLGDFPALKTQRDFGGEMVVSWPAAYTNFVLYTAPALASANWMTVTNATVVFNQVCFVTNPITSGNRFFQLIKK